MADNSNTQSQQTGIDHIKIEGEKLILIEDSLGKAKAAALAEDNKAKAFGMMSQFLFHPKKEDIEIIYEEKRYQAFWHIVGKSFFEYRRKAKYKVPVETIVENVTIEEKTHKVEKKGHVFEMEGIEHCKENYMEEIMVDAQTDQPGDFKKYLDFGSKIIDSTEELTLDGTPVVALETKASFLVRKVLNALVKPIKADVILAEKIGIETLSLYFYPIYTFEYVLKPKDKHIVVELDGVTGEFRKGKKITDKLRKAFSNDELFEFAKEVANFIPGGGLVVMAGKKAVEIAIKK